MASHNRVTLIGNLTRSPEMKFTPRGTAIANFGLAINHKWKDDNGDEKESVTFVDCKIWGKRAEVLTQHVKKGHPLFVDGRLDLEQWEDKATKEKRQKLTVVVEDFQFLKAKENTSESQ